jgi:hypothetical protein
MKRPFLVFLRSRISDGVRTRLDHGSRLFDIETS